MAKLECDYIDEAGRIDVWINTRISDLEMQRFREHANPKIYFFIDGDFSPDFERRLLQEIKDKGYSVRYER